MANGLVKRRQIKISTGWMLTLFIVFSVVI